MRPATSQARQELRDHRWSVASFISMNWRGRSLTDVRTIVELIGATKTETGLCVQAVYDPTWYPTGEKIRDDAYASIPLTPHEWHGEWNYTIARSSPRCALSDHA